MSPVCVQNAVYTRRSPIDWRSATRSSGMLSTRRIPGGSANEVSRANYHRDDNHTAMRRVRIRVTPWSAVTVVTGELIHQNRMALGESHT